MAHNWNNVRCSCDVGDTCVRYLQVCQKKARRDFFCKLLSFSCVVVVLFVVVEQVVVHNDCASALDKFVVVIVVVVVVFVSLFF